MKPPWKLLCGSVVGTSHKCLGESCQDYAHAVIVGKESPCLVAACSDGAGSASHAGLGSKVACLTFIRMVSQDLRDGRQVAGIDAGQVFDWYSRVRGQLSLEAAWRGLEIRDFACTLLTAIVAEKGTAFAQIGDGAIVFRDGQNYCTAFWPQTGEYASTTFFLTGPGYEDRVEFRSLTGCVDELALLTDGIQPLALHYASRTVHADFFAPMFDALRRSADPESLESPLRQFLGSKPVTDRTDDDKTLILATRFSPQNDAF
jgi:hypothetical protein